MIASLIPVILCGGSGTRLWPVSRSAMPKQFVPLIAGNSLFVEAVKRSSGLSEAGPLVVTGDAYRFIVRDQLADAGIADATILIEPESKNTAPAIASAALLALESDPEALLLVMPSDHLIPDTDAFMGAVRMAVDAATKGSMVTFGIEPTRPETGYGYLEPAEVWSAGQLVDLRSFVEKPSPVRATEMVASGRYLWNAGIFLFRAQSIVDAFERDQPDMLELVSQSVANRSRDLGFERLAVDAYSRIQGESIDYAIMEKAENLKVVAYQGDWSDLGDWEAVWRATGPDESGLVERGGTLSFDCRDSFLLADSDDIALVGVGLENIAVVATGDAVLVASKDRVQDVKRAVEALRAQAVPQANHFRRDHRPWGWYDVLALSDRFQVKRIVVRPGAALSLQSHVHRSEHWIVVSGTARVTIDETVTLVAENESVYIPLGARHRLENPGKVPMTLIEVQTGSYLGEDDIVRYDDRYARS